MPGQKVLLLGSGPTMTGQSREYNSVMAVACETLLAEGHSVVLLDSQTASPLIGCELCNHSYIEPLTRETLEKVLQKERPHSVFATVSGKNTFNFSLLIHQLLSVLNLNFTFLGTTGDLLASTQKPDTFKSIVEAAGEKCPDVVIVNMQERALDAGKNIGFPVIVRAIPEPSGIGVSIAYNVEELEHAVSVAMAVSPIKQIAIEKSFAGRKCVDWVVLRDRRDNVKIIGNVEYIEPIGVHSDDSIAVSPAQSISPEVENKSRKIVEKIVRAFNITGCSTVKLAYGKNADDEITVINFAPRITRAAILCGQQIGVPIAEWHTRLCINVGINDLLAAEAEDESSLFVSEKDEQKCWCRIPIFPGSRLMKKNELLTTFTKSVDSVAGVGNNFISALQKAIRAAALPDLGADLTRAENSCAWGIDEMMQNVSKPFSNRIWLIYEALKSGIDTETLINISGVDKWFISQLEELLQFENKCSTLRNKDLISKSSKSKSILIKAKTLGCSNSKISIISGIEEKRIAEYFKEKKVFPNAEKLPDGYASKNYRVINFSSKKTKSSSDNSVLILGNCNLQAVKKAESEYLLAEAARVLIDSGYNCLCCSSDTLHLVDNENVIRYIEPLDFESIENIIEIEKPKGIIAQFGDYHSYKLIEKIKDVPIFGASFSDIQRLYKRERFFPMIQKLDIRLPAHGIADNAHNAFMLAKDIGYPVIVHPAVPAKLPAVDIWYNENDAKEFLDSAGSVKELYPISIEKFLEGAREFHIEGVCDKSNLFIGGIIEHIEKAGVSTEDSAAVWSPASAAASFLEEGRDIIKRLALELKIKGLIGIKLALSDDKLFLLDVFPGATRNTAFINKISGEKLVPAAVHIALGKTIAEIGGSEPVADYVAVRSAVFPFANFPESDASLGPESCSVGSAVGLSYSFGTAYAKSLVSTGNSLPTGGSALLSVTDKDKNAIIPIARELAALGFNILATSGTYAILQKNEIQAKLIMKFQEGRPNVIDSIIDGDISLIINTPGSKANRFAEAKMRHEAVARGILVITTIAAAQAAVEGIAAYMRHGFDIKPFEKYLEGLRYQRSLDFEAQPSLELGV